LAKVFLDTNVIIYANDARDSVKQQRSIDLVTTSIREATGVVSTQVLQEYAVVASTKLAQDEDAILRQLHTLESMEVVLVNPPLIRRALEMSRRYRISYWDACILAAAEHSRCSVVLSEDLNSGQLYATTRVENPFL
jgi:predicted nucleic acid-binding protein